MPGDIRTGLILTATARGFEAEVRRAKRAQSELNKEFRESRRDARGLNADADRLLARYRSLIRALTGEFDPVLLGE